MAWGREVSGVSGLAWGNFRSRLRRSRISCFISWWEARAKHAFVSASFWGTLSRLPDVDKKGAIFELYDEPGPSGSGSRSALVGSKRSLCFDRSHVLSVGSFFQAISSMTAY